MEGKENAKKMSTVEERALDTLCHHFCTKDFKGWSLLRKKLVEWSATYKGKHSVKMCRHCLCILSSHHSKEHTGISVENLFKEVDVERMSDEKLAELIGERGRTVTDGRGGRLIGFPGINLPCEKEMYLLLAGSLTHDEWEAEKKRLEEADTAKDVGCDGELGKRPVITSVMKSARKGKEGAVVVKRKPMVIQRYPNIIGATGRSRIATKTKDVGEVKIGERSRGSGTWKKQ